MFSFEIFSTKFDIDSLFSKFLKKLNNNHHLRFEIWTTVEQVRALMPIFMQLNEAVA